MKEVCNVTALEDRPQLGPVSTVGNIAIAQVGGVARGEAKMATTMLCILLSTLCGVTGQVVLKKAMLAIGVLTPTADAIPSIVLRIVTSPLVIIGMSCYVLGSFFWLITLSRAQLSFAYPFASLSYILIFAAAWLFYGETISPWRLAGMLVICVGVALIARS